MSLDGQILIACTTCFKAKVKCDKKAPCTRCVTKQLTCESRSARRSLNPQAQKHNSQLRPLEPQPYRRSNGTRDNPLYAKPKSQSPVQQISIYQPRTSQNNSPRTSSSSADVSIQWDRSPERQLQTGEEMVIVNNHPDEVDSNHPSQEGDYGYLNINESRGLMDLDMTDVTLFSDIGFPGQHITPFDTLLGPWADVPSYPSNSYPVEGSDLEIFSTNIDAVCPPPPNNTLPITVQDHATIISAQEAWSLFRCNPRTTTVQYPSTAGIHLQGLEQTLTSEYVWTTAYDARFDPSPFRRIAIEPIQSPSREKLLAVTQMLFHYALSRQSDVTHDPMKLERSLAQVSTSFIILPPPKIMDNFLRSYGNCFESYYRLTSRTTLRPGELMLHQDSKVPTILILLMVAFGATFVPTIGARHIASGLTEVCRIALWNILERDMTLSFDPMISQCALLYLTLGIWSGDKWHMDLAMSQRGSYIYMLCQAEVPRPVSNGQGDLEMSWKCWREQESQNRLKYAWVMADQEWSLFHDTTTMFSINTLREPMPSPEKLWKADSAAEWSRLMKETTGTESSSEMSLRNLYKHFMDGEVLKSRHQISPAHLRLLLHPLQALVCHLRQCLQCFSNYGSNRKGSRALSRIADQAQLDQVRQLLQQWYTLSSCCSPSETTCSPIFSSSLVIYHLVTLNTMISFTDMEEVAALGPSKVYSHYEQNRSPITGSPWREICHPGEAEEIFFHCGQLLRLYCRVPQAVQPIWWPAVLYRVALTAWFTSMSMSNMEASSPWDSVQPAQSAKSSSNGNEEIDSAFAIDDLPPDHSTLLRYVKYSEGDPMFSRPGGGFVSLKDPNGILRHCIVILKLGVTSRLRDGIKNKLELLAERWKN